VEEDVLFFNLSALQFLICSFLFAAVLSQLDDIVQDPEHPDKECIVNFETKSLRDTRQLLETVPISEAYQFVEGQWRARG
jgi:WD repeat-containing protein 35